LTFSASKKQKLIENLKPLHRRNDSAAIKKILVFKQPVKNVVMRRNKSLSQIAQIIPRQAVKPDFFEDAETEFR